MDEEIRLHRRELEKSMSKKDVKKTLELLRALDNIPMTLDVLVSTQIGAIVNKARKTTYDTDATELVSLGRKLVKRWKGQLKDRQDSRDNNNANNINSNNISTQNADKINLTNNSVNRGENGNQNHSNNGSNVADSNDSSNAGTTNSGTPRQQQQAELTSQSEPKPSTSSTSSNNAQKARAHPVRSEVTQTTDPVRLTIRKQLTEALKVKLPEELTQEPFLEEDILAARIEESIYQEFNRNPNDAKYRNRCRSRVSNLRDVKNPYLRYNVLRGDTAPERFAKMTAEEMASDELKKEREKFTKEAIMDHQMALTQGAQSSEIKCPACKKYNCTYNQMQTRSADEPMTTFCHCNECGRRWKFC